MDFIEFGVAMKNIIIALLLTPTQLVLASGVETTNQAVSVDKNAVPIHKETLRYPREARKQGREGWVVLSYVVSKEGEVVDPIVVDSSGQKDFENAALSSIKKWKYEPAFRNGQAVEQCHTNAKYEFILDGKHQGGRASYGKRVKKVYRLISKGDLEEARLALDELSKMPRWNLYEDAWYWFVSSEYYKASGDTGEQLNSLRRAVAYEGVYLPPPNYVNAVSNLYVLEMKLGNYSSALKLAEIVANYAEEYPDVKNLLQHSNQMKEQIRNAKAISMTGKIGSHGNWCADLMRNEISFETLEGNIERFELRCGYNRQTFNIDTDLIWSIPESWGECSIVVFGEAGATFTVTEYQQDKS